MYKLGTLAKRRAEHHFVPLGIKFAYGCQANTYLAAHTWIGFSHILQSPSKVPPSPGHKCFYAGIFRGGNLQRTCPIYGAAAVNLAELGFQPPKKKKSAETWICKPRRNCCFQRFPNSVDVRCKRPLTGFLSNTPRNKLVLALALGPCSLLASYMNKYSWELDANTP